jgi:ABC-type branched-subunit amino acid transport system ATPase component
VNQERKVTIAVIEHDMDSIMELCPRIVVLNAGAVIADGTPTQVTRDPLVREAYLGT